MSDCLDHGKHVSLQQGGYYRGWSAKYKRLVLQHRLAYIEYHNLELSDIDGKVVRHTCDNRRCINPEHLLLGTQLDNIQDMVDRDRYAKQAGEENPRAVLTWDVVADIRRNYKKGARSGEYTRTALAEKYGVSAATISDIVGGRSWINGQDS